ncbi:hypothetical protein Halru_0185 [Halovivax ruber XH-70]|uniref:DUF7119 domain-containing protein n=1 Tax=Halovivax ruber (strain DSM 18193 / JCM 13892 / XH-70) TaxID=797302 RepID=L0I9D3_HALRX|nr:hypothetical protein [Halovivax ruber]AGB14831.1 hypothetical protein Halru_0185 [Halovivax ruber XH-70]
MPDGPGDEGSEHAPEGRTPQLPTDRESPVGEPVIRGDETVTGEHASDAVQFDPDDPASVDEAADVVRAFATADGVDHLRMLRGAAACAALVRGVGSYTAAADRAGGDVTVSFVRKWARVHDLPRAVRTQVARGEIAPSAAKHLARIQGSDRFLLAWTTIDAELSVREVRRITSDVADGTALETALAERDIPLGTIELDLPPDSYRELRRRAALEGVDPGQLVADALRTDRNV